MEKTKKKTRKPVSALFLCILLCVQLAGCHSTELAKGFDEDTIIKTAQEIINDVQLNGAEMVLKERLREGMMTDEQISEMDELVKDLTTGKGGFVAYTQKTVVGRHHDELDEDLGVILVTASYEKGEINYTLTFDKDMKLVGFYPK